MININKRWLLTASPWMRHSLKLSPFGIGGIFLCALLLFGSQGAIAQIRNTGDQRITSGATLSRYLPAITASGSTTICMNTTVTLSDATAGGVWTSSNPAVGTVSAAGVVTGISGGSTIISYSIGTASATMLIMVTYPISGATGVCAGNYLVLTDGTPTGLWSSSNTAIATVDASGNVYGASAGTVVISYGRATSCIVTTTVTVGANTIAPITGPVLGALAVCQGGTAVLSDATTGGVWSSSNNTIAAFVGTTSTVSGVAAGAATVTYTVGGCNVTHAIVVTSPTAVGTITGNSTVCVGDTVMLTDAATSGTWGSVSPAVATVNASGIVSGISAGTATISYYKLGCSVNKVVTVNPNTIAAITGGTNICIGQSTTLADVTPSGTWSISNVSLATIGTGGIVTGIASGSPIVTYTAAGCYVTLGLTVNNSSTVVGAISGSAAVCKGSSITLSDAVAGGTWAATNANATVNAFGVVTGVTANGIDTIMYTRLGCYMTQIITVNPLPAAITGNARECLNGGTTALSDATAGGTWSSTNPAVATVGTGGIVTGVAISGLGTAYDTIKYTLPTGCYVQVSDTAYGAATIIGGNTVCTGPFVYLELHDPTIGGAWSSSNTAVGTVSATGAVSGLSAGTTNISYTVTFSGLNCSVINQVTVNVGPGAISGNVNTCIGTTTTLSDPAAGGVWTSNNTLIATVVGSTGVVTGVAAGGAVLSYTMNGCSSTANVLVTAAPAAIGGAFTVCSALGTQVISDATPGGTWSASSAYINIAQTGSTTALVTGVSVGTATVSYTLGGCAVTQVITISTVNPAGAITGTTNTLCTGGTQVVTDANAGGFWSSSNSAVVAATGTTASIAVSALAVGTAVLSYTMPSSGCFKTWTYTVDRSPSAIFSAISGIPALCGDSTLVLSDTTAGGTWTTSNSHIATVGTNGAVFGVTSGHATITYGMPGGCIAFEPITVNENPGAIAAASGVAGLCVAQNDTATLIDPSIGGTWSSSNTGVGTIDPVAGILTGMGAGTTNVTYTLTYGTSKCFVTKSFLVGITVPTIVSTAQSVCANGTAGTALVADTAAGIVQHVGKWTVNNSLIASINASTGAITGVAAGTVVVTFTTANSGCYATLTETVFADTMASITGSMAVCAGSITTLTDAAGVATGKWSSSVPTVGAIGAYTGILTAGASTGYTIVTFSDTAAGGCRQWASVNVGTLTPVPITTPTVSVLCPGTGIVLTDGTPGGAWTISNPAIALVNYLGGVDGVTAGTATVSYTIVGCSATTIVTVNPLPTAITGPTLVCVGSTATLNGTPAGGTWTSSSAAKGPIDVALGVLTGTYFGTVTINYTLSTGCTLSVIDTISSDTAAITGASTILCGGYKLLGLSPSEADGYWSSNNEAIATVTPGGGFTGLASGTAVITYASYGNCVVATQVVTVNYVAPIANDPLSMCLTDNTVYLSDATTGGAWTSSAASIVTVGTNGQLTGVSGGSANISYTYSGCSVTAPIAVALCPTPHGSGSGTATGVNDENATQVYNLFPNPGDGNMTITQSVVNDETMQVSVMNQVGAVIYTGSMDFAGGRAHLVISEAIPGIYLVLIQDKKGAGQTFKVLIEK